MPGQLQLRSEQCLDAGTRSAAADSVSGKFCQAAGGRIMLHSPKRNIVGSGRKQRLRKLFL
jgi:hypothetical protein